ncbi:hypothetical protein A3A09_00375 [Candidatus Nomurabacteria bacterium RIFCSPLOWO2_01_FULL_42_20]|uniref:Acyl-homoserine-lactone synthase n=1 Tax=Candidatus Nomurabacteria bacterium RIFCSPHIGHO2_01_FULL_42_16 TaxID=1801743 RepID=A0A1F6VI08_9BACT|nr:MAG: hypothetical protein A2824_02225 [Candidatus Nomurabacteria bacterium RIFCSPHIGHO2_01_FULL_42_16]OGI92353.1 MAG: hypothetical protein A3A09_00375 [Candidatus Nomurabacteria bacterium RIFCSPLOWO2_01_FULL_42_20]
MCNDVIIRIAKGGEIQDFKKFLFKTYCLDLGWHDPAKFPKGIFTDEYDEVSVFLVVYSGHQLISGVRLVADSEKGFPHEHVSMVSFTNMGNANIDPKIRNAVKTADRSKIMEITRCIAETKARRVYMNDLMKAMYWFGVSNSIEIYFMVADVKTFLLCHKLGFPVMPVGIPFFCEGSWTIPAIMLVADMIPKNDIRQYFLDKSNLVGKWGK